MYRYHAYDTPKRILITGGAGFIGSHLCERFINDGHEVICLDNYFTGNKENVSHLMNHHRFELIRHDITEPILMEADWIFNLACPASPIHYQYNPVKTIKVNVLGALNMLGLAKRVKARILQASTSEIYGDPDVHPQKEEYWGNVNPIGKRSCYDEGKRVAETLFFDYMRQNKVDIKVVRIFNTYGPRMRSDDGRVVSNFIVQALKNEPITMYGDGSQTRSFCYIDDMIEGLIRMMDYETGEYIREPDYTKQYLSGYPGPINLGNPHEVSIYSIAKLVTELAGSKSEIVFRPLPEDDPKRRCPDITKAKGILEWQPYVQLEEGLRKTVEYFRKKIIS
ncbi:MAG TPA: SDR family oxidoreductase [Syntrophorhabdaceae bacterium]|jgi:UDP-glucuronate decarboxylase|nr:SDR family oxidoreductase [Syntrophorhabdaceae bacterium]MBV6505344.1 UDP-glucose 4-epimerase [Syntrophorhabdaceae bacterium]HNZ57817.1 SDR family oxidoreductase [Syntrophorhabdaceae bacterium]HOS59022.1 SDR family oxidoreductase [Syntrophorhabdaceae bacterium]HQG50473.1 SDR family oxidoreductase [Syntrophorhabdaceae bacterium]